MTKIRKVQKVINDTVTEPENVTQTNEENIVKVKKQHKRSRIVDTEKKLAVLEEEVKPKNVIYIGHLPWGFNEEGIKKYFSQFGEIDKTFQPRSKKTGRSKGYAFVQFKDENTAKIAAETMNNFILFDRILKCSVVEDTNKYSLLFLKCKRKFKFCNKYKLFVENRNRVKTAEETKSYIQFLLNKEEEKRKKLKAKKIKYEFPGYKYIVDKYVKKLKNKGI